MRCARERHKAEKKNGIICPEHILMCSGQRDAGPKTGMSEQVLRNLVEEPWRQREQSRRTQPHGMSRYEP